MTAKEYFDSQAHYNQWLRDLTLDEQRHVIHMLEEFAIITVESGNAMPPEKSILSPK